MNKLWCYSLDGEKFSSGTYSCRDLALKNAQSEGFSINKDNNNDDIKCIHLAECKLPSNEQMFPDADIIIEHMMCQAEDIGGENASDYPDVTKEQEADLTSQMHELLSKWCKKNEIAPTFYTVYKAEKFNINTLQKMDD